MGTPCPASQAATFAPEPPPAVVTVDGVSLPRLIGTAHRREDVDHDVTDDDDVEGLGALRDGHALVPALDGRDGDARGEVGVAQHDADVGLQRHAATRPVEEVEQEGRHVLAAYLGLVRCAQPVAQQPGVQSRVDLLVRGERVGQDEAAVVGRQVLARGQHGGDLLGGVDAPVDAVTGVAEVEAGEGIGAVADDRDAEGLEPFQGGRHVEDRLDAGAHDGDPGGREGLQVCGLVPRRTRVAVHAAETAGGEDVDAREGGQVRGGGDRRCPRAVARDEDGEVASTDLHDVVAGRDAGQRVVVETDAGPAVDHGDRGRDRSGVAYRLLDLTGDAQVVGPGEAVADDRGLEGHDGTARREGVGHLGQDGQHASHAIGPRGVRGPRRCCVGGSWLGRGMRIDP